MCEIIQAVAADEIVTVRLLLREYQAELDVDLAYQDFETEVRELPGAYSLPQGQLLLATHESQPVGIVALRDAGGGRAEMKRLFVRPSGRRLGVGGALVARLLSEARDARYKEIVLDTLPSMQSAQRLYAQFGFEDIPAYRTSPVPGTRYLGLTLGAV